MRVIQKEVLKRWREIAEKHKLPLQTVKNVEASIWVMVKEEMTKGNIKDIDSYKNIFIRYLGTFHVSKGKYKHIKIRKDEK